MESATNKKIHTIDASDKILGRLAVDVANILRGRNKASFLRYKDLGEEVIVFNADKIKTSGNKAQQKVYRRHSGYPGGMKEITLEKAMVKDSREVVRHAVKGMMPKNRLSNQMIKKLTIYKGEVEK